MKKTATILTVFAGLTITGGAQAGFTFENPPYSVGDITGQDSWTDGITLSVTDTNPIAGTQSALATDRSGEPGNDGTMLNEFRNITGLRTWADGTRISTLFRADNNGTDGGLFDFRFDTVAGYLGDITINSWSGLLNVDASGTIVGSITTGTIYQVVVEFNFTADSYDAILQTVDPADLSVVTGVIGSAFGVPFANSSTAADANTLTWLLVRAQNSGPSTGATAHFDNMLIESLAAPGPDPEPALGVVPTTAMVVEDTPAVSFDSTVGITYYLQSTPDLVSSNFTDVGAYVDGNDSTLLLFDPDGLSTSRNYRVTTAPGAP
jgi:hypothetical protein